MIHDPVLTTEVLEALNPQANENFIDATLGFAGHASLILQKTAPKGKLLGIDQDEEALESAQETLSSYGERVTFVKSNFANLALLVRKWPVEKIDGILLDLGTSNYQLTSRKRGFSFQEDAPLDMRMDPIGTRLTAAQLVNKFSEKEITEILFAGEEKFARKIAHQIVLARQKKPIETTKELVEIVRRSLPPSYRFGKKVHFATDTFRALRMYINDELGNLKRVLPQAVQVLSPGGRLAVITFQSLEDRIVKNFFRENADLQILTSKPIGPTEAEILKNPRSRSAKLRVAIKK